MRTRLLALPWPLFAACVVADAWPPTELGPPGPTPAEAAALAGRVVDPTGAPVPGAFVTVDPSGVEARTDDDGRFLVPRLPPGERAVVAAAPGFSPARTPPVELALGATAEVELTLLPASPDPRDGALRVTVFAPDGSPAEGARVDAKGPFAAATGETRADGVVVLEGLGGQPVAVSVDWPGARVVPRALDLEVPALGGAEVAVGLGGRGEATDHVIGTRICGFCHPAVAASWEETGHARTLGVVEGPLAAGFDAGAIVPLGLARAELGRDPSGAPQVVLHDATGARDTWPVAGVFGSGTRGAVPYATRDGRHWPLPVAWVAPDPAWAGLVLGGWTAGDRGPWLDGDDRLAYATAPAPSSSAEAACFACHVTGVELEREADGGVALRGISTPSRPFDEAGVGCEACHGLGQTHTSGPLDGKRGSIVIPDALGPDLAKDVCGRCHAAVAGDHGLPFAWTEDRGLLRPGDALADHVGSAFVGWPSGSAAIPGAAVDELRDSAHGRGGWNATCADCHDPHGSPYPADLRRPADALCQACHLGLSFEDDPALAAQHGGHPDPSSSGCAACHQPETAARVAWRPETGAGDLASHAWIAVPPADAVAAFVAAGQDALPAGSFPPSACQACHTWSAFLAGSGFPGAAGDPLLRATHEAQQAEYEAAWP